MQRRSSRAFARKIQRLLPVGIVILVLYVLASHDYVFPIACALLYILIRLVINQTWLYQILDQVLAFFDRSAPTTPYYQPPQERVPYQQGYPEQPPPQKARPRTNAVPKDVSPVEYEQPQAQYPEQLPPMA